MSITRQELIGMNPIIGSMVSEMKMGIVDSAKSGNFKYTKTYGSFSEKIAEYIAKKLKETFIDCSIIHYEEIEDNSRTFRINWEPV